MVLVYYFLITTSLPPERVSRRLCSFIELICQVGIVFHELYFDGHLLDCFRVYMNIHKLLGG